MPTPTNKKLKQELAQRLEELIEDYREAERENPNYVHEYYEMVVKDMNLDEKLYLTITFAAHEYTCSVPVATLALREFWYELPFDYYLVFPSKTEH